MKRLELVRVTKRRSLRLKPRATRRLMAGIAVFSATVCAVSTRRASANEELPQPGTTTLPTVTPPTPPVTVTPTDGGGTVTIPVGGNNGTLTGGLHNGDWSVDGDIGDPLGDGFHLGGHLDSGDWSIGGSVRLPGTGVTGTLTHGSDGTTVGIAGPLGGGGGTGTLTHGPDGTAIGVGIPVGDGTLSAEGTLKDGKISGKVTVAIPIW